jgi:hypothetical protein
MFYEASSVIAAARIAVTSMGAADTTDAPVNEAHSRAHDIVKEFENISDASR